MYISQLVYIILRFNHVESLQHFGNITTYHMVTHSVYIYIHISCMYIYTYMRYNLYNICIYNIYITYIDNICITYIDNICITYIYI